MTRIGPTDHPYQPTPRCTISCIARATTGTMSRMTRRSLPARSARRTVIGPDTWIGHGAIVKPEVTIGAGADRRLGRGGDQGRAALHDRGRRARRARCAVRRLPTRWPGLMGRMLALAWWDWPSHRARLRAAAAATDFSRTLQGRGVPLRTDIRQRLRVTVQPPIPPPAPAALQPRTAWLRQNRRRRLARQIAPAGPRRWSPRWPGSRRCTTTRSARIPGVQPPRSGIRRISAGLAEISAQARGQVQDTLVHQRQGRHAAAPGCDSPTPAHRNAPRPTRSIAATLPACDRAPHHIRRAHHHRSEHRMRRRRRRARSAETPPPSARRSCGTARACRHRGRHGCHRLTPSWSNASASRAQAARHLAWPPPSPRGSPRPGPPASVQLARPDARNRPGAMPGHLEAFFQMVVEDDIADPVPLHRRDQAVGFADQMGFGADLHPQVRQRARPIGVQRRQHRLGLVRAAGPPSQLQPCAR